MAIVHQLQTPRLRLRQWKEKDLQAFARLNADDAVMEFFPNTFNLEESKEFAEKYQRKIEKNGWGFWVTERLEDGAFIGLVGLNRVDDLPIGDCVEVGWRLAKDFWGFGYATEAARACLEFAFDELALDEVVAITTVNNTPSRRVMDRLDMIDSGENFEHPRVDDATGLKEHVLYKISRERFLQTTN
ncbi:MAG: GNAT family N-acetyltransferase [Pseudomonadales bacterium]|nr:GNAT family N-acetyltransferase [Pseudomonadales bacterium]